MTEEVKIIDLDVDITPEEIEAMFNFYMNNIDEMEYAYLTNQPELV